MIQTISDLLSILSYKRYWEKRKQESDLYDHFCSYQVSSDRGHFFFFFFLDGVLESEVIMDGCVS